ncbi:MAG: oxidase [Acidobacteria bacterium]|nr:MAG: oxidase [Acidobacteriota bacterium]
MSVHVVPKKIYFAVFILLLVLTGVTIRVAFVDLGRGNTILALTIAVVKALFVILYFMHVRYSPQLTRLVVVGGFFWLFILIAITMSDYLSRGWLPFPGK